LYASHLPVVCSKSAAFSISVAVVVACVSVRDASRAAESQSVAFASSNSAVNVAVVVANSSLSVVVVVSSVRVSSNVVIASSCVVVNAASFAAAVAASALATRNSAVSLLCAFVVSFNRCVVTSLSTVNEATARSCSNNWN
jgi:hypothetical protein